MHTVIEPLTETIKRIPGYDPYALGEGCWFDPAAGQEAIDFIEGFCTHVKGPKGNQPLLLEPWQKAVVGNLYGWKRLAPCRSCDGTGEVNIKGSEAKVQCTRCRGRGEAEIRRYRKLLLFVPRGNAKTTLLAALILTELYTVDEVGSELYSAASETHQARLLFTTATKMIRNDAGLDGRATIWARSVVVGDGTYETVTSSPRSKHGFGPQCVAIDELHAHETPELTHALVTGTGKRSQALVLMATTADVDREGSICNAMRDHGGAVRDNPGDPEQPGYDPSFLPVIYEAEREDDWKDPATWEKANPLIEQFGDDYIRTEFQNALTNPSYTNTFKRLHLNMRTGALSQWIPAEAWSACCDPTISLADFEGEECWIALDIASTQDFNAACYTFRRVGADGKPWVYVFWDFWVPRDTAESADQKGIPYLAWAKAGLIILTPGASIDYGEVHKTINKRVKDHRLNVQEIAADRAFVGGHQLCHWLSEDGYVVLEHGQGMVAMALPIKNTEGAILGGSLVHDGNKVQRWMMGNAVVDVDSNGNKKLNKKKAKNKIDGCVAMGMAVGRALHHAQPDAVSAYEERELFAV